MKRTLFIITVVCILTILYSLRVYSVNHSPNMKYMPTKIVHKVGSRVEMPEGYYFYGYNNLTGYHVAVNDVKIVKTEDILAENEKSSDYLESLYISENFGYVCIISTVFDYDDTGDPTEKYVDLTGFTLVGKDYYFQFSTEINQLKNINTTLDGNHMFSIRSGNPFEVDLVFLIDTESLWAVPIDYLVTSKPMLLLSQYPEEVYLELDMSDIHS